MPVHARNCSELDFEKKKLIDSCILNLLYIYKSITINDENSFSFTKNQCTSSGEIIKHLVSKEFIKKQTNDTYSVSFTIFPYIINCPNLPNLALQ